MSPSTAINVSATSQQNIGLDKQTLSGIVSYNWFPSKTVTNTLDLFNVQFVKNLNTKIILEFTQIPLEDLTT